MELSICTDILGYLPFEEMLAKVKNYGLKYVELGTGGWSPAPHVRLDELLSSKDKLTAFKAALQKNDIRIAAFNCSGNPLEPGELGKKHTDITHKTMELAGMLGVKKVVMMSGLPAGAPGDTVPNWVTYTDSWPDTLKGVLDYQWNTVAIPFWKKLAEKAKSCGVEKIALENFSSQLVYNPDTLLKLRNAVDPIIGMNLDPSHLWWMGGDPIAAARALGPAIHHVHGKDVRVESGPADINGTLETRPVEECRDRAWNYVAVGCGHDLQWWKEFFSVVRMMGYDDIVSLEMEDLTMSVEAGVETSVIALQQTISR